MAALVNVFYDLAVRSTPLKPELVDETLCGTFRKGMDHHLCLELAGDWVLREA